MSRSPRTGLHAARVLDVAFFALYGCAFFAWWVWADPTREVSATQFEWPHVLAFSGVLLLLGCAVARYASLVDGRPAFRASLVVAGGAILAGVANVFEDGLQIEWVFFVFVLCVLAIDLGLIALAIVLVVRGRGGRRLLALVPVGTLLAIIFAVEAGGPIMLVTWLGAAAVALTLPRRVTVGPPLEPTQDRMP